MGQQRFFGWHRTRGFFASIDASFVRRSQIQAARLSVGLALAIGLSPVFASAAPQVTLPVVTTAPLSATAQNPSAVTASPTTTKNLVQSEGWATLLEQTVPNNPALLSSVISLMNESRARGKPDANPSLMVVSYHNDPTGVRDVVIQLYSEQAKDATGLLNPQGTARSRLGDELFSSADGFLGLIYRQVNYLGEQAEVQRQQRAMASTLAGDLTLLREQTIEPLHVVAVMPQASQYLPGSLRLKVRSVVVNAELTFGEWRGKIGFVTGDERAAEQVGYTVAAWREMAVSMADTFASYSSGKPLRDALNKSTIEVAGNQVLASVAIPSDTVVRVAKEAAGHGGGCPSGGVCGSDKVAICHGQTGNKPGQTLCVSVSAVASHLAHGDTCGPCAAGH
jgi:hypothetical protein